MRITYAFPHQYDDGSSQTGMNLRDYFAAAALTGLLACDTSRSTLTINEAAEVAYNYSDEMIRERGRKS